MPTATVCTNPFSGWALQTAAGLGLPSLPLVLIPHPLGDVDPLRVQARAEQVGEDTIRALTTPTVTIQAQPALASNPASLCTDEVRALDEATLRAVRGERLFVEDSVIGAAEASRMFYGRSWTDGLPIIRPISTGVGEMIRLLDRLPDEMISQVPPPQGRVTLEKMAVNAVMAGCPPEHFPLVTAAVKEVLEPSFGLAEVQATSGPHAPLTMSMGP